MGTVVVCYIRLPSDRYGDTMDAARAAVHEQTDGIVHMLRPDKWLTIEEIADESRSYNKQAKISGDGTFETDHLQLAEYMALLVSVGLVAVKFTEDDALS